MQADETNEREREKQKERKSAQCAKLTGYGPPPDTPASPKSFDKRDPEGDYAEISTEGGKLGVPDACVYI